MFANGMPETQAEIFEMFSYIDGEYIRPQEKNLIAGGGKCIASSNWDQYGNIVTNGYSFSPSELWEFMDGSKLYVGCSACYVVA